MTAALQLLAQESVAIEVLGLPAPKGSARAIMRGGFAVNVPSGSNVARDKLRGWNAEVMLQARQAMNGAPPIAKRAVAIEIAFRFPRPKGHLGAKGIKPNAPKQHTTKPDLDKLLRSTWDALAGIVFDDDSRISAVTSSKSYCDADELPGATITVHFT